MPTTQTILITGASSGIGLCAALTLQQHGHRVFASVRKAEDRERLEKAGIKSVLMNMDDSHSIRQGLHAVLEQTHGKLDVLINNAGFGQMGAVEDLSREVLRAQFETNVFGLQELTNLVVPIMRQQRYGKIINLSSLLGFVTMPYRGAYCASKYAVEALSDALRMELHGSGVSVSIIEPGPITSNFRVRARADYHQHINIENSAHKTQYVDLMDRSDEMKGKSPFTLGPEAVAAKILKILDTKNPKLRYPVTFPAYLLGVFKRLLPGKVMDALLRRV